jgi:hypothetical protein
MQADIMMRALVHLFCFLAALSLLPGLLWPKRSPLLPDAGQLSDLSRRKESAAGLSKRARSEIEL